MARLESILDYAHAKLSKRFSFSDVDLKHPLPERPVRLLGLLKIDGRVLSSDSLSRVLLLSSSVFSLRGSRSIFLSPSVELDLPIFSTEVILLGKKRGFLLDVQRRGGYDHHDDTELYGKLIAIRNAYPDLLKEGLTLEGEIQQTMSPASIYVKISKDQDDRAFELYNAYLDVFIDLVERTMPVTGETLERAKADFSDFVNVVMDHDPGVKIYKTFFGEEGGKERALDMFFAK
ncbi:MAG: hypothetical protein GY762_01205 [Proteobacteria bacterium]|nr:hypothetical protein [Pseudomonadota bacterium]